MRQFEECPKFSRLFMVILNYLQLNFGMFEDIELNGCHNSEAHQKQ